MRVSTILYLNAARGFEFHQFKHSEQNLISDLYGFHRRVYTLCVGVGGKGRRIISSLIHFDLSQNKH